MEEMEYERRGSGIAGRIFRVIGKTLGTILLIGMLSMIIFACIFTAYMRNYLMPQVSFSLDSFRLNQTSVVYYEDDSGNYQPLQNLYGDENRIWASYDEIPTELVYATVAIEDKRFYEHNGVDWFRTATASVNMFLGSKSFYGGSTLTQQLIKNLTNDDEVTVRRKLVEIFRALAMEKQYSKEEILEWYLNTIYLGEQSYGVRTASYTYFGKDVSQLDLAECASLIAITNNPSMYDPYISDTTRQNNKERQKLVLKAMLDQGYITQNQYNTAVAKELVFTYAESGIESTDDDSNYYSYFVDQVIRDVVDDLAAATGYDTEVINRMIMGGGYQIYSTIDPDVQSAAEEIYENLENIPATDSAYQQLQSGIVIIDNETGDISAIVGGVGEKEGSLNWSRATQSLLSPGSIMKPIAVYGPALNLGMLTPATVYDDVPYSFGTEAWPKNEDDKYHGLTNILTAMKRSSNTIAVQALDDLSVDYAYSYVTNEMGLTTLVDEYELGGIEYTDKSLWSLALGGMVQGVTIREMTAAYAAVENGGQYREARTYTKVLDSEGNLVLDNTQSSHEALSSKAAYYLTYMMEETVKDGTAVEAQMENMAVAGKTGTTSDDKDRWFAGYTPYYTAVVWCGYDQPQEIVLTDENVDNPACVLWNRVMTLVHESKPLATFEKPAEFIEVEVCADSGLLCTKWCHDDVRGDRAVTIVLAQEDVPTESCSMHLQTSICTVNGEMHVAGDKCASHGTVEQYGMLNYNRSFPLAGVIVYDQQYCVGSVLSQPGYSKPRCGDTLSPINETCTVHTDRTTRRTTDDDDGDDDGAVITMPTVQ